MLKPKSGGLHTLCPACEGEGHPGASPIPGPGHVAIVAVCRTCAGTGWLPGIQPPC